jgi:hypothetical protein
MILHLAAVTAGVAFGVLAVTAAGMAALVRVLSYLDPVGWDDDGDEPAWWPDFERAFAAYAADTDGATAD